MLKVGLIGFGGIAKAHRHALAQLKAEGRAELVCAYDIDPTAFEKRVTINLDTSVGGIEENIRKYTDLEEMLAKEQIDFIVICAPSFVHSKLSVDMLRRGYPVLCEKPMALYYKDCEEMIHAAKESGKELMVGQCLRFYPAFNFIKEAIDDNRFGKVLGAYFSRLSAPPTWGWENWFMSPERSGGCITDLHVHDVDIIRYLFGEPEAISCRATSSVCKHDTVHTSFFYGNTPITAIGDWSLTGIRFNADCRIDFEKATIVFDSKNTTVYPKDGSESYIVPLQMFSGQHSELTYFCDVIEGKIENTRNPATSAAKTIRLVEVMRESADRNGAVMEFKS